MNLLVVEDDPEIAAQICAGLRESGHCTSLASCGTTAIREAREGSFDAIVLDRLLPDLNGLAVLEALRGVQSLAPVIMLSALGSVNDRIEGLRAGADDYLAKPFDIGELSARVEAIARRGGSGKDGSGRISVGRLVLDPEGHRVSFDGRASELNRKQVSLLAHLMRNADRLVTRRMLLEHVWGYVFEPTTNIVESNMSRLRGRLLALGCDAIETRRGSGYVLVATACA